MASGTGVERDILEWGVASAPLAGQVASGDLHLVRRFSDGGLIAAVDALGHGPEAARAAQRAVEVLGASPRDPIAELIRRCHHALTGQRGVVLSLASFEVSTGMMTWAGVGNVEGVLIRGGATRRASRSGLVVIGGIVGGDLPEIRPQQLPVEPGDLVVFATDGVRREFVDAIEPGSMPARLASDLLARFSKGTDDALVVVARYLGPPR
jgi:serine phosphatase RsbU (regulator of sigma subunit)